MTITKSEGDRIIKNTKLPFGCDVGNPTDGYKHISFCSEDALPIATVKEYEIAERIAQKYDLKVVNEDFGKGEGMHPDYKTVFVAVAHDIKKAKTVEERITKAEKELEQELARM